MTTREKYLAKPRTDFKRIAYNIARMLGLKCNMIHPKAVREYSTSRQLTYHEVILLVAAALAITAITTLASCSADDPAATITPNQPIHEPMQFVMGPQMGVTRGTSVTDNNWATDDAVAVVLDDVSYQYTPSTVANSTTLVRSDVNKHYWKSSTETKTIHAWSFGNTTLPTCTSGTGLPSNFTLTNNSSNNDLLYATGTATYPNAFSLTFYHQLAKLTIKIKSDVSTAVTGVTCPSMYTTGTINLLTGNTDNVWTGLGGESNITAVSQTPSGTGVIAQYTALVIPAHYNKDKVIFQIATSAHGTYNYAVEAEEGQDFFAGKHYTYTITIKNQIVLNTVSVEPWASAATGQTLAF